MNQNTYKMKQGIKKSSLKEYQICILYFLHISVTLQSMVHTNCKLE